MSLQQKDREVQLTKLKLTNLEKLRESIQFIFAQDKFIDVNQKAAFSILAKFMDLVKVLDYKFIHTYLLHSNYWLLMEIGNEFSFRIKVNPTTNIADYVIYDKRKLTHYAHKNKDFDSLIIEIMKENGVEYGQIYTDENEKL